MDFFSVLWIFLIISAVQPVIRQRILEAARRRMLRELEEQRGSRVIVLIHRQETLAETLSSGRWTHDYPITVGEAHELGLDISLDMPEQVYKLMSLYPQASQRRPSVEYIPSPYAPAPAGERKRSRGSA